MDTYGNVLCFDELLDCPINSLKIDHINKANLYLAQNYKLASLSNVHEDYKLFFSNNYVKGNVATIIIRTKDEPKFITNNNFILDSEAYKEIFGDQEFLNNIADAFGLRDNEKEKNDKDKLDKIITIFQKIEDTGDDLDYVLKVAKLLYTLINYEYNKNLVKLYKYVKEQITILDEDNIDTFFEDIGNNFYIKNYIGFECVDDINKFMRFDYNIYKKRFPTFLSSYFALAGLIIISLIIVAFLYALFSKKK